MTLEPKGKPRVSSPLLPESGSRFNFPPKKERKRNQKTTGAAGWQDPEKRRRDKSIGKSGPVDRIVENGSQKPTRSSYTLTRRDRFDHPYLSFRQIQVSAIVFLTGLRLGVVLDKRRHNGVRNQAGRSAVPSVR